MFDPTAPSVEGKNFPSSIAYSSEVTRRWKPTDIHAIVQLANNLENKDEVLEGYTSNGALCVRRVGDQCSLEIRSNGSDQGTTIEISEEQFQQLWVLTESRRVEKSRHHVKMVDGSGALRTLEIDMFKGELAGLVLVECKFPSLKEAESFEPLAILNPDVTAEQSYEGRTLAMCGLLKSSQLYDSLSVPSPS